MVENGILWRVIPKVLTNPLYVAVGLLEERQLGVYKESSLTDRENGQTVEYVRIMFEPELARTASRALDRIAQDHDFIKLARADAGNPLFGPPDFRSELWGEITDVKLLAHWWRQRAKRFADVHEFTANIGRSQALLRAYDIEGITKKDISVLVEKIIARQLAV